MTQEQVTPASAFPVETIDLPSGGSFYPTTSPLSSGKIDVYYMTAKHEDILTSTNLINKGIVLDKFLDAIIATKGVTSADLLIGDLNAVMVAARILGYGKDYEVTLDCPSCGKKVEQTVDLTQLEAEHMGGVSDEALTIKLPKSTAEVKVRLMTRQDELDIEKEVKALKKLNSSVESESTTRLRKMIVSVNGDSSAGKIWQFVDSLLVKDARYLREQYRKAVPDVNFKVDVECDCGTDEQTRLPIGTNFFWPDSAV